MLRAGAGVSGADGWFADTPAAGRTAGGSGFDTEAYHQGAEEAWRICSLMDCQAAVLKERSPSCGHGVIYDGTFSGCLTEGSGVTAQLLAEQGIPVYGESQIAELLR